VSRAALLLGALALAAVAAGCSAKEVAAPGCSDLLCGAGFACVGGSCLPMSSAPTGWAIELEPSSDETEAGFTESTVDGPGALDMLVARGRVDVIGGLVSTASIAAPAAGHVVLTVPATIPGRPDQQFETDVMVAGVDSPVPSFTITVPEGTLGRPAHVIVSPTPPDDQVRPPLTFQAPLAVHLDLTVPARLLQITGNLYSADSLAQANYLARAFLVSTGQLVSNVSLTNMGGGFSLLVPATAAVSDPSQNVSVELRPADSTTAAPRFVSKYFSATDDLTLGNLYEPAFALPNVFRFVLRGDSPDAPAVADALVHARTVLASNVNGSSSDYQRDGRTDAGGSADLALLPGTLNASRSYAVTVIPPAGSRYGVRCVSSFPLTTGGSASAPALLQVIPLPQRPTFTGTLLSGDGSPVERASITATPVTLDSTTGCTDAAGAPPATATTGADGSFSLVLDPGTYRFDYDPPRGAPVPRLTELEVAVPGTGPRTVRLAPAGLVAGTAFRPDGKAKLPSANVRLYELRCPPEATCMGAMGLVPVLRAQARTDTNGAFRAVIPLE